MTNTSKCVITVLTQLVQLIHIIHLPKEEITVNYAFLLTDREIIAMLIIALLLLTLAALGISAVRCAESYKKERSDEDVRYRPPEQNTHI